MPVSPPTAGPASAEPLVPAPIALSDADRAELLAIVRRQLAVSVGRERGRDPDPATVPNELLQPADAFVTLTEFGELRGCCGTVDAGLPVCMAVSVAAASAALRDPRFMPLTLEELPAVHAEVSVLGPAIALEDPAAFRPGVHGLILRRSGTRALLLPEVATEAGWGSDEMLEAIGRKAGLGRAAWRSPGTSLSVFRTVRFGGPALAGGSGVETEAPAGG